MALKTRQRRQRVGSTRKRRAQGFEQEVTVKFLEMLLMVKLYHWKTYSYATHKATDELYESLNENIDKFIEVLLGKTGVRIDLMNHKTISLIDLNSKDKLKEKIDGFKYYLVGLTNNTTIRSMKNSDLLNIRDEILGNLNQFLYLLTFK
jgi:DNA-binding ferritin-like protein